jgi:hypothetical protein
MNADLQARWVNRLAIACGAFVIAWMIWPVVT